MFLSSSKLLGLFCWTFPSIKFKILLTLQLREYCMPLNFAARANNIVYMYTKFTPDYRERVSRHSGKLNYNFATSNIKAQY